MRSLELAGTAGLVVIVAVMVIIIFQSIHTGMPAIRNGEMPLWSVQVGHLLGLASLRQCLLSEAFAEKTVLGHGICCAVQLSLLTFLPALRLLSYPTPGPQGLLVGQMRKVSSCVQSNLLYNKLSTSCKLVLTQSTELSKLARRQSICSSTKCLPNLLPNLYRMLITLLLRSRKIFLKPWQ